MTSFFDDRPKPVRSLSRFLVFALVIVIAVTGLTARLFYLQIVDGGRLSTLAARNRTVLEAIKSPRGLIYDRTGRALVSNVATFVVKVRPADLPLDQRPVVVDRLAALLRIDAAEINAMIDGNPGSTFDLVRIARMSPRKRRGSSPRRRSTCPEYEVDRRGSPAVHGRPPAVADPRLHGPGFWRAAAWRCKPRATCRRPDRQSRRGSGIREGASRRLRQRERRTGCVGSPDAGAPDGGEARPATP